MQAHRLFYRAAICAASLSYLSLAPPRASTRAAVIARLQYLLARTLRVDHDDLEEVLKVDVEKLHQRLPQFGTRPPGPRLQRRNIVLADAKVVRQLALRQTLFLAHRPQPGRPNFDIHLGIITRTRIFVKTCLQNRLTKAKAGHRAASLRPVCRQVDSSSRA